MEKFLIEMFTEGASNVDTLRGFPPCESLPDQGTWIFLCQGSKDIIFVPRKQCIISGGLFG